MFASTMLKLPYEPMLVILLPASEIEESVEVVLYSTNPVTFPPPSTTLYLLTITVETALCCSAT